MHSSLEFLSYSLETLHAGAEILQDLWRKILKLQVEILFELLKIEVEEVEYVEA